ncbi:hypothetical protein [Streptomyces sp. NPDC003710]
MPRSSTRLPVAAHAVVPRTGHCAPLLLPPTAPHSLRMTALVLAAHTSTHVHHSTDMDVLARLCGHSAHQTAEPLDRLAATGILAAWHPNRDTDEVLWQLPRQHASSHPAPRPRQPHSWEP